MEIDIRECKDTYAILITYFILVLQHGIHIKRLTKCHWFSYVFIYKINDILLILIKAESEITNKTSPKFIQKSKIKKTLSLKLPLQYVGESKPIFPNGNQTYLIMHSKIET